MRWDRKDILSVAEKEYAFEINRETQARAAVLYLVSGCVYLPNGVFPVALYGEEKNPLIYGSDGMLYQKKGLKIIALNERFSSRPACAAITVGDENVYVLSDGKRTAVVGATGESSLPGANSLAFDGERLFLAAKNAVFYTRSLPVSPYVVVGEIRLPTESGEISDLIVFDGYVYCFCDNAVYRIAARGGETAFTLERVHVLSERAERRSPVVCGEKIYYLSGGDLFSFDGSRAERIALSSFLADGTLVSADRRLLLKGTTSGEDCVLVYDTAAERSDIVLGTYGVLSSAFGGSLFVPCSRRYDRVTESSAFPARSIVEKATAWKSGFLDFGKLGNKRLIELLVTAEQAVVLTLSSERETARYSLAAGESSVFTTLCGERFCFSADSDAIRRLKIIYRTV